jgi:hypothetical protein
VRMFSAAMTPVAVLRWIRIGIGRCPLWRRCAGILWHGYAGVRLSEGRAWGRGDHRQSTQDQGATHGPDDHIHLHVTRNKGFKSGWLRQPARRRGPEKIPEPAIDPTTSAMSAVWESF